MYLCTGVLVYTDGDKGACEVSVATTLASLKRALSWLTQRTGGKAGSLTAEKTDAAAIEEGTLSEGCRLLVMPGGRDLPYCHKLNGLGNARIRDFVRSGGSYLGICAGGYYATSYIEFAKGDPVMEVVGPRELGFFPGAALGPAFPGFRYDCRAGARACSISLRPAAKEMIEKFGVTVGVGGAASFAVYYNGGCYFAPSLNDLDCDVNMSSGSDLVREVSVLATYNDHVSHSSVSEEHSVRQMDIPYTDGTDPSSNSGQTSAVQLPDTSIAAVSVQYGMGKVVLTGMHPESSPASLAEHYVGDEYVKRLLNALEDSDRERETFFNSIIGHLAC